MSGERAAETATPGGGGAGTQGSADDDMEDFEVTDSEDEMTAANDGKPPTKKKK